MVSELELREKLADFVAAILSRDEFEDWFVQRSWNIHRQADLAAQRLAYAIELRLAENSSGHLPEADLLKELSTLLKRPFVVSNIAVSPALFVSSSSSFNINPQRLELHPVDIRPATASGSPAHR